MIFKLKNKLNIIFIIFAIFFLISVIVGLIQNYSSVPYMDEWDGFYNFYLNIHNGNYSNWFAQHNEHRIFVSKFLFWLDIIFFQDKHIFLLFCNFLSMACTCLVFIKIYQKYTGNNDIKIICFLICWIFSWSQAENITLGFQIAFFLSYLLSLCAFYFLHMAVTQKKSNSYKNFNIIYFLMALLFAFLSIGTTVSGLFTLPLMLLYSFIIRTNWFLRIILLLVSFLTFSLYFFDYSSPSHHNNVLNTLTHPSLDLVQYVLLYLGNPFQNIFGLSKIGLFFIQLAGGSLIVISIAISFFFFKKPIKNSIQLILIIFILFIAITAFITATGRLNFGLQQALSSRYATPVLMGWAALIIVIYPYIINKNKIIFLLLILVSFVSNQLNAIKKTNSPFEKEVAALAVSLNILDEEQIRGIYPDAKRVLQIANEFKKKNISIYSLSKYQDLKIDPDDKITLQLDRIANCNGNLDRVSITADKFFTGVEGWLFDNTKIKKKKLFTVLDQQGRTLGFIISGKERVDVATKINNKAINSGFKGYISSNFSGMAIIKRKDFLCKLNIKNSPFSISNINEKK
jgi:hypothetical protein